MYQNGTHVILFNYTAGNVEPSRVCVVYIREFTLVTAKNLFLYENVHSDPTLETSQ